jgi:hypothetical protein
MKQFNGKTQLKNYLKKLSGKYKFSIEGSTSNKPLKNFSDVDVEIYGKVAKPYYEMVFVREKPILITIYYYKDKNKKFKKDTYNLKQKIKRECQLAIDFMFKYLRTKNKKYLKSVQKRI